jgi:hypothetical protein
MANIAFKYSALQLTPILTSYSNSAHSDQELVNYIIHWVLLLIMLALLIAVIATAANAFIVLVAISYSMQHASTINAHRLLICQTRRSEYALNAPLDAFNVNPLRNALCAMLQRDSLSVIAHATKNAQLALMLKITPRRFAMLVTLQWLDALNANQQLNALFVINRKDSTCTRINALQAAQQELI